VLAGQAEAGVCTAPVTSPQLGLPSVPLLGYHLPLPRPRPALFPAPPLQSIPISKLGHLAELDKEERLGKYTLAELEEEEQSLDRRRRWYRELRSRDLLGTPATTQSATALKICEERFESYADHVYAALSSPTG